MTVTNTAERGTGICTKNNSVELIDVALKGCTGKALHIPKGHNVLLYRSNTAVVATRCEFANSRYGAAVYGSLTSATFKNCVFHDNEYEGIYVDTATAHFYGEATTIHSNGDDGIYASHSAKVIIHLPSKHNTSYNNSVRYYALDRHTMTGGTITNVED